MKTRALMEGDHEVLEILSDSESEGVEMSGPSWSKEWLLHHLQVAMLPKTGAQGSGNEASNKLQDSDMVWEDPEISLSVLIGDFEITKEVYVQRIEYLSDIPSIWPVPCIATAFVVDLKDPKFEFWNDEGDLYSVDALIKNKYYYFLIHHFWTDSVLNGGRIWTKSKIWQQGNVCWNIIKPTR
ncbi:hypothetical protein B0H10DRAFT_1954167 [Mycena sp. CBHHK59/15]|nr:hypothetical protein B0H10DRAFT_1954167 [Mycena sp. CBHHK59/15]